MAQVDALRFLANLQKLFAPAILDGQEFTAYIDGDSNSLVIKTDNIVQASSGSNIDMAAVASVESQLVSLKAQADSLENFCGSIPALQAQLTTLSGSTDGEVDFEWALLSQEITELKGDIQTCNDKITALEESYKADDIYDRVLESLDSYSSSDSSDNSEEILILKDEIEELKETVATLSSELHGQVTSETTYDVS